MTKPPCDCSKVQCTWLFFANLVTFGAFGSNSYCYQYCC